jgi:hypothetical protein
MIRQIDKSRFNIPLSGVLRHELAWWKAVAWISFFFPD